MKKEYFYDTLDERNKDWHEKNFLINLFYKLKFLIAIRYADLKEDDIILDFGSGSGWLKKRIPNSKVIGYDIDPKLTEVKEYTNIKFNKIFALDVFEHIKKKEIRKIIQNFKKTNPNFTLVIIVPNETWFWVLSRKLLGLSPTVKGHITKPNEIFKILNEELTPIKKTNLLTLTYIAKFKWKIK